MRRRDEEGGGRRDEKSCKPEMIESKLKKRFILKELFARSMNFNQK